MSGKHYRRQFMKRAGTMGIAGLTAGSTAVGTVAADEDAVIRGGIFHGDRQTGIEGASITLDGPSSYEIPEIEESWYHIDVESGEYTVEVDADGYEPTTKTVTVESRERKDVNFNLQPENAGTLKGTLVDENGDPIDSDRDRIYLDGERSMTINPDSDVGFEIDLQEGLWVFDPEALGYDSEREIVSITEGETTEIEAELTANNTGEAVVFIWMDGDVPPTDILFEGPTTREVTYDGGGAQVNTKLEAGQYIVEVDPEGYETKLDAIEIEQGSQTYTDFDYQ